MGAIETDILFAAQHAWCKAGASRKTIRPLFEKLYEAKIVSFQGLVTWRDDRVRGKKDKKPMALLGVNNWLTDITPEPEEESDEEEQDEEGQEQDEFAGI